MELLLLIIITFLVTAQTEKTYFLKHYHGNQCYFKDVLAIINHSSNQLAVNIRTNTLFFSSDISHGEFMPLMLDIDTKKLKLLKGVKDAYAIASNNKADDIYFGGSNGIHRYRAIDKTLTSLAITNLDIWWLHYKKDIYFVQFPQLHAYVYKDRTIKVVRQLKNTSVHQFVFDKDGHLFFLNTTGLYGVQKISHQHILLRARPSFTGIATDNEGKVFVSSDSGIYLVSKADQKVRRIVRIFGVQALAFDKDNNLIYSDAQELVRLMSVATGAFNSSRHENTYFCN